MPRHPRHDILFQPLKVGPRTLKNRFYGVPYGYGAGDSKPLSHIRHREVEAEGGWAVVNTGVTATSVDFEGHSMERLQSEDNVVVLAAMVEAVHMHGALAGIEFGHVGADAANRDLRTPAIGPSQLASWRRPYVTPKAMEQSDIDRVLDDVERAAGLALHAGFDLVSQYGAFSYLSAQFLSPFHNHRTDHYGGSLANRARFWLESLERIRRSVGTNCIVSARIAAAGLSAIGISLEETLEFVALADEYVDLWDITVGAEWEHDSGSSMFFPEGWQTSWSGRVRDATAKPIVGVGRLTNPDLMAQILESGVWDLIGAARPRIADPFLPKKIEAGRYTDIRECTGSNVCVASMFQSQMTCFQNPAVGEEHRHGWHPERFTRAKNAENDVLIVGAGPAGLECALTLARRGMRRIHLVDAKPEMGGSLRWVSSLPLLAEWHRVIDYRKVQIDKLKQIQYIPGTQLSAAQVLDYGAEYVILASGASWAGTGLNFMTHTIIPGADATLPHVLTPDQLSRGKLPSKGHVVVYDCDGLHIPSCSALWLRERGYEVTLVTPHAKVAPFLEETMEANLLRARLRAHGIRWRTSNTLENVAVDEVEVVDDQGVRSCVQANGVVLATHRLSEEALYLEVSRSTEALRDAGILGVYRIGDCVAPRTYADAVFDAHRLAQEIDSENPAVPQPVAADGLHVLALRRSPFGGMRF